MALPCEPPPLALSPALSRKRAREKNRGAKVFCDSLLGFGGAIIFNSSLRLPCNDFRMFYV
jgi:hypothetical protein